MHNEAGSSSGDGQPVHVDKPDHSVIPVMWMPVESLRVERMTKFLFFNLFQNSFPKKIRLLNHSCSRPNLLSHSYYLHEDKSPLNSSRETCAQDSQLRVFLLFPEAALAFSASGLKPACVSKNNRKRLVLKGASQRLPKCFKTLKMARDCVIQGSCKCRSEHQEGIF